MKLSESTLQVLKNFANINPNIVIQGGNEIKTISEAKDTLASAELEDTFEAPFGEFGIYDLHKFLSIINLSSEPELKFSEKFVTISDDSGRSKIKYHFSDPEMLTSSKANVKMGDPEVTFVLDQETLNKLKRAASALGYEELVITPSNKAIRLTIRDTENPTSDSFSIDVAGDYPEEVDFTLVLNIADLKLLPADYDVGITSKLISSFKSKTLECPVSYWIALKRKSSNYGE